MPEENPETWKKKRSRILCRGTNPVMPKISHSSNIIPDIRSGRENGGGGGHFWNINKLRAGFEAEAVVFVLNKGYNRFDKIRTSNIHKMASGFNYTCIRANASTKKKMH